MNFDLSREWLVTNGIGGFASSTVIGCNTRRYHALLCAATRPPLGRMVLVNKADETLTVGARSFDLGSNQYPGTIHPTGFQYLREFHLDPLPRWIYEVPGATLERTLWMPHGQNRTVVRYRLLKGSAVLAARPFVTGRDYHGIHRYNESFNTAFERHEDSGTHITLRPYDGCTPIVWSHDGEWYEAGSWYHSFEYSVEQERGLDFTEDAWCPGAWVWRLNEANPNATWVIATEPSNLSESAATHDPEVARLHLLQSSTRKADDLFTRRLALAADQFVVRREDGLHTVLAGYPWFSDWGRDTMIALPGLCISTGRFDIARSILQAFAAASSEGMIPNRFPDAGDTPDYNTVDATLWFFHAVARYIEASGDQEFLREIYPVLRDALEWHWRGTRYGIAADPGDGTLRCGDASTQLTWMDAKVGGWVVTPRYGKPVEIQALWFNALRTMLNFADTLGDAPIKKQCGEWSRKVKANFTSLFWNEAASCLYDCISDGSNDGAVRPNQIFVVSLPHRLLTSELEKRVVATVQRELLTPYGLRSLSPHDAQYRGIYIGDQWQRDGSYHQGTVWGWLIGPFLSAYLKVNRNSARAKTQVRTWMEPLQGHLDTAGLGSVSEIFDGDAPHTPRGCFAQAWSVAEPLRVLLDEL
jgi:predicted glycogen debranching enzyme